MASIRIPDAVLPGFKVLSDLTEQQVDEIADYFAKVPVGTELKKMHDHLLSSLNLKEANEILQTIISFSELLEPPDVDFRVLADNLASSFYEQSSGNISDESIKQLGKKLFSIFSKSRNLKLTLKAVSLSRREDNLYGEAKSITDIRPVFDDDIDDKNRSALIVHYLHIDYYKDNESRNISLALDLRDLKKLQGVIERAIAKDKVIRTDYNSSFNFLNLTNDI